MRRLGATSGTPSGKALSDLIRAMLTAELPGSDREGLMPPVARYWFRRVPGHNFWLWDAFNDAELILVSLTSTPPVPIDSDE